MPKGKAYDGALIGTNYKGKVHGGAGPKSTTDGKSTDANAKNTIATLGTNPKPVSPNSSANSRNK